MSFSRHITRNFNANKTNRIRYDEDDFLCQIFRFDKTYEKHYTPSKNNLEKVINGDKINWNGMSCYRSKDSKQLTISLIYDAKTSGNYRLELLFANTHKETTSSAIKPNLKASATITINGEKVKNSMGFIGTDVNFSRNYQYCTLKQGENKIEYSLSSNTLFIGLAIKKYDIWEAKRHNTRNDALTMIKATVEHTNELQVNTMTAEFMYYHKLDELLEPTDSNANRSGLIFDYRDEINLYVRDTSGKMEQVFGGYISTATVDGDDLTKMTLECADRLIDLDRRYCLSEITINNYQTDENADYSAYADYKKNYNNYSDPLKFLLNNNEILLKSNLKIGDSLVDRTSRKLATYKKDAYSKLTPSNMGVYLGENGITLRNGADTLKPQSVVIYDDNVQNQTVLLNTYPNLYFHYGLGVEKWEEKVEETRTVTVQGSTQASSTWINRANKITSATGNSAIKPIWQWCYSELKYVYKKNFYQSASKTYSTKKGNCCCQTEVLLNLLNAKGVSDLNYCHSHNSKGGHIFAKVNGMYLDPTTRNGYGSYIKTYGKPVKITQFPNKPF